MNILDHLGKPARCEGDPKTNPDHFVFENCRRKVTRMLTSFGELEEDSFSCELHCSPYDGFVGEQYVVGFGNYPPLELVGIR